MSEWTNEYGQRDEGDRAGVEKLKAKVGEAVEPMKEKAAQAAREQKEAGAGQMQKVAQAVHGAARELESQMPKVASLIHDAGDHIDRMAANIRDKSLEDIVNSVRDFARQQPALVFGGAMVAGLLLSRFLKSSPNTTASQGDYYRGARRDYYKAGQKYDTSPEGDYGVAAGRHYDEQTSRPH